MNEVKFNTQICTTREQSERLLSLGLNSETADMYIYDTDVYIGKANIDDIPAWSLHRLIELLPQCIHLDCHADTRYWLTINPLKVIYKNSHGSWIYQCDEGGLYDKLINTIEWTIKNNHFNKEYYYERCKHNHQRSEV
jgi:hypothetical protein